MALHWARGRTQGGNALAEHIVDAFESLTSLADQL